MIVLASAKKWRWRFGAQPFSGIFLLMNLAYSQHVFGEFDTTLDWYLKLFLKPDGFLASTEATTGPSFLLFLFFFFRR